MTTDAAAAAPARRALVVEDDADVRGLLTTHLRRLGWSVDGAATGEEAVERALAAPPQLVVVDVVLPGISGYDVVQSLRQHPTTRGCEVVMTSMLDLDDVRGPRLQQLGVRGVLAKPFTRRDVVRAVAGLDTPTPLGERP
ncbi:response regulator [Vallicoccus soli]|uniref:Response regulator n=1 Tax=Vallicoccus soli TaxID=2339232 RepID=A0A3A3Z1L9_9ACTN|nr:response regulator [Vallicoccus soli]RJK98140.1 response regulator [Vallicoccus soli]